MDGGALFQVACLHGALRFAVDRIRDAEAMAMAMADYLRTRHSDLRLGEGIARGGGGGPLPRVPAKE